MLTAAALTYEKSAGSLTLSAGPVVSRVTARVTSVLLPAASVATMTSVFWPSLTGTLAVKLSS